MSIAEAYGDRVRRVQMNPPLNQDFKVAGYLGSLTPNVTGFRKTNPTRLFGISRITDLKYLTHCESRHLLGCNHAKFTV